MGFLTGYCLPGLVLFLSYGRIGFGPGEETAVDSRAEWAQTFSKMKIEKIPTIEQLCRIIFQLESILYQNVYNPAVLVEYEVHPGTRSANDRPRDSDR